MIDKRLIEIRDCLYRVAVKAVIVKDNRVLLVKDATDDGWCLPGGGVDVGESLPEALRREIAEEIGVKQTDVICDNNVKSIIIGHIKRGIPLCNIHFMVTLANYDVHPTEETVDLEWININELDKEGFDTSAGNKEEVIALIDSLA